MPPVVREGGSISSSTGASRLEWDGGVRAAAAEEACIVEEGLSGNSTFLEILQSFRFWVGKDAGGKGLDAGIGFTS